MDGVGSEAERGAKHLLAEGGDGAEEEGETCLLCVDSAVLSFTQVLSSLHVNACQSGFEETGSEGRMEPADGFICIPVWWPFPFSHARSSHSLSL